MRIALAAILVLCASSVRAEDRFDRAWSAAGFAPDDVSSLIRSWPDNRLVLRRWASPWKPAPVGSLVKPFLALAYAAQSSSGFPRFDCNGDADGCWLPQGHGELDAEAAIALSCNAWFAALAARTEPGRLSDTLVRLSLPPPPPEAERSSWWGLGEEWMLAPTALLEAYAELPRRGDEPGAAIVLGGLRRAAREGTAVALAQALPASALAKTGTAPCSHTGAQQRSNGDGWAIALYPSERPRYAALVQVHGVVGRRAAEALAAALRALESIQ